MVQFKTPRCLIRPCSSKDQGHYIALNTHPLVRKYLGGPLTEASARKGFMAPSNDAEAHQTWSAFLLDGHFLGSLSLGTHHNMKDTEISYLFSPEYWGQGLAQESIRPIIDYYFTSLKGQRLLAETQAKNKRSHQLLKTLNFELLEKLERFGSPQAIFIKTKKQHMVQPQ